VPGGHVRGRVPQENVNVNLPTVLIERIEDRIKRDGSATSVADFLRQSAVKELDRQDSIGSRPVELMAPMAKRK
jgi:Arc/MetJ-type ribon-helix-helix transcriptional regulator